VADAKATSAVVLLSGGLDSTTVVALAREERRHVHALTIAYGQRHAIEIDCARWQAKALGCVSHEVLSLEGFGHMVARATALCAESTAAVPAAGTSRDAIPITYIPARNTVFLALALAYAEVVGAAEIWIGINDVDYAGYPDCRPEFLRAFEALATLATRDGVEGRGPELRAPLLGLDKAAIVAAGRRLGVDFTRTTSCYDPRPDHAGPLACGVCDSCGHRRLGFSRAGVPDPTRYAG
jgi:7-cyano-7-deazaguanine synthase